MQPLQKITWNFYDNTVTAEFREDFNQATLINFDPTNSLFINLFELKPAVTISGVVYPTFLELAGNVGEVNNTTFTINTRRSSTGKYTVVYSQYVRG